jgi:hypothetical protein
MTFLHFHWRDVLFRGLAVHPTSGNWTLHIHLHLHIPLSVPPNPIVSLREGLGALTISSPMLSRHPPLFAEHIPPNSVLPEVPLIQHTNPIAAHTSPPTPTKLGIMITLCR